jgi:hypothetical protein
MYKSINQSTMLNTSLTVAKIWLVGHNAIIYKSINQSTTLNTSLTVAKIWLAEC